MRSYHQATNYKEAEDFKRLDFIVDEIIKKNFPNPRILDIGCGNGNIAMALGSLGFQVLAIDIDHNSISTAIRITRFLM